MKLLLDTGPLVAIISRDDAEHQSCTRAFQLLNQPPITSWPVITEAAWILRHNLSHVETLLRFPAEGLVELVDLDASEFLNWLHRFFTTYADQQPQLADASLMYLAEKFSIDTILTLDRRDFSIYRTLTGNKSLTIIPSV